MYDILFIYLVKNLAALGVIYAFTSFFVQEILLYLKLFI